MPNYRMVVAYDGAPFHGFARQPDVSTVQGEIEAALARLLGESIATSGAGRTDAGVHALGQVMSFRRSEPIPDLTSTRRSLNAICGPSIAVLDVQESAEGFDARFSAIARSYEYAIFTREVHDPFSRHTTWHHPGSLDTQVMGKAAQALLGEHDFSSFGRVEPGQSPRRLITSIDVDQVQDLVVIRVTANSFIQQMVRSIVGTLVRVGEGRSGPEVTERILHAHDRAAAGSVAPPHGLFLVSVSYPEELV